MIVKLPPPAWIDAKYQKAQSSAFGFQFHESRQGGDLKLLKKG
jgi:hypothetical protein